MVLCGLCQAAAIPSKQFAVDHWTDRDGLSNNSLSSLVQSRDGYLWVGSLAGATRFDGVRFTPVLDSLPNAHIRTMLADREGNIWVSMVGAGLARVGQGRIEILAPSHFSGPEIRVMAEDGAGRIWVGSNAGVNVIDHGRILALGSGQSLGVSSIAPGRDRIWIATDAGICVARSLKMQCNLGLQFRGGVQETVVQQGVVMEDHAGRLWIGGSHGLFSLKTDLTPQFDCAAGCFEGRTITALREARNGNILVGFDDGNVSILRNGLAENYGMADGLASGPVVSLLEDNEGSIWIGIYNGPLERLRPTRVRMYTTDDGLPAKVAGSIVQDRDGTIWAGSQCGPVSEFRDGRFVPRFAEYTRGACGLAMWAARDGALWIGTDNGLFRWFGGRMQHFGRAEGLSDLNVRALFEDREGTIWIGTLFGGLHRWANGKLSRPYGSADGVAAGQIESFAEDHEGRVWIGSNGNGLSVFEHGTFRIPDRAEQPPDPDVSGLFVDRRGDLWVATDRSGVFRRHGGKFENFGPAQGLDRLVALMLEDRQGTFWVSTAKGIHRIERDRIEAVGSGKALSLEAILLDRADGMLNPEVSGGGFDPTGLVDRDGKLWFSTIDGIAVVDPAKFRTNTVAPPIVIENVSVAGKNTPLSRGGLDVPAGGPQLEIAYTALSFLAPHKVRFRYRMRGLETNWEEAGTRRTAYYPHLAPGPYTFEVIASNSDGVWSTNAATLQITVAPFWWERAGIRVFALLVLIGLTGVIVRAFSARRAAARVAELERRESLNRERDRIAQDIHDDLGARLTRMSLISDGRDPAMAGRIGVEAREAIQAMDELVWIVNTRNENADAFISYSMSYGEEFLRAARIAVRIKAPAHIPETELRADVRRQLFLTFKESLNNVAKHSSATECHLEFEADLGRVGVMVRDNGRGFDPSIAPAVRNGLRGMGQRMAAVGGSCEIRSSPGNGTSVHIHVTLPDSRI